jgi:6-pyruvoyltetrahydropterin/6-carboxytetrahydropterin synthase
MFLTRKAEFSASHVCANPALSAEENFAIYGANANPHGHGHNYVVEVTLEGEPDPVTGMVFDLRELKEIINAEVIDPMDHRFLNREVPPFDTVIPTTENIAREIWKRLAARVSSQNARLKNVRLYETADLYVDCGEISETPCN